MELVLGVDLERVAADRALARLLEERLAPLAHTEAPKLRRPRNLLGAVRAHGHRLRLRLRLVVPAPVPGRLPVDCLRGLPRLAPCPCLPPFLGLARSPRP